MFQIYGFGGLVVNHYFGDRYIEPGTPNTPSTSDDFDRYSRINGVGEQYGIGGIFNIKESGHSLTLGIGSFYRAFGYKINPDTLAFYGNNGQIKPIQKYLIADRNFELQIKYAYKLNNWFCGVGMKFSPGERVATHIHYVDGEKNTFKRSRYNFGDIQLNPYLEIEYRLRLANEHKLSFGINIEKRRTFNGSSNYWDFGGIVRYILPI